MYCTYVACHGRLKPQTSGARRPRDADVCFFLILTGEVEHAPSRLDPSRPFRSAEQSNMPSVSTLLIYSSYVLTLF